MIRKLIRFSVERPRVVMALTALAVVVACAQFFRIKVDTDPENMLSAGHPDRVFHNRTRAEFALHDFVVLGIVDESNPDGVFTAGTLGRVYAITERIRRIDGVIAPELISPSTKEDIEQAGVGAISFGWLMPRPPATDDQARHIRERALANPMYAGSMVSDDGKALALYVPIERKDMSWRVSREIRAIVDGVTGGTGPERYYITGLPVAEDTFGHEMFVQMAVSAPLAAVVILLLMYAFFRRIVLIVAPMILAVVTVLITMGLLIGFGYPVHIMSSMIPIFLMPIAVLDSVHILSEFFDDYRRFGDKKKAVVHVLDTLFVPMLYTSLTTFAGFISLSFSDIPPVQVFGAFVAFGVAVAWLLTMTFIPAYTALIPDRVLGSFGAVGSREGSGHNTRMDRFLRAGGTLAVRRARTILALTVLVAGISFYGISRIHVNDNPVKWFTPRHEIRVADAVLNRHFSGTYMAYLVMADPDGREGLFKEPAMLEYIGRLQEYLQEQGDVGKSTTLTDVVKKVYFELMGGSDRQYYAIPGSSRAVSQALIQFENSRKPDDLWHLVTPDFSRTSLWIQLKSGDNRDMERVMRQVETFTQGNPAPFPVDIRWAGKTFVNVVWQNNMVAGMLRNFFGSFVIVYFMMVFLLGSPLRALISMIPLTFTIVFIYGLLGLVGRDYDMPVAVLSALTLGLSVDFAIHFMERSRSIYHRLQDWAATALAMFDSPARAITRNAVVVAVGFLPLLMAPLVPYQTVGVFMALIMFVSGVSTMLILPALVTLNPQLIYARRDKKFFCYCGDFTFFSAAVALSVVYLLLSYTSWGLPAVAGCALLTFAVLMALCRYLLSSPEFCARFGVEKPDAPDVAGTADAAGNIEA